MINIPIILTLDMISVFKFWTIGGIFLYMFSDALLFDMVLNTAFQDGIDSIQDLNDRDMSLGIKTIKSWSKLKSVTKLISSSLARHAEAGGGYENIRLWSLRNIRNDN